MSAKRMQGQALLREIRLSPGHGTLRFRETGPPNPLSIQSDFPGMRPPKDRRCQSKMSFEFSQATLSATCKPKRAAKTRDRRQAFRRAAGSLSLLSRPDPDGQESAFATLPPDFGIVRLGQAKSSLATGYHI